MTLNWKTIAIVVGIVAVLVMLVVMNHQHRALLDARQAAEAAQLQMKGQLVAEQTTSAGLRQDVAQLVAKNSDLRASYEAALAAAPGAQPIHAESLSTGAVVVAAGDNSGPTGHVPDAPVAPDKGSGSAASGSPEMAAGPACVLHSGDAASIAVDQVTLLTKTGNYIIAGAASAWRETPPRERLFGGKFNATASSAEERIQPPEPRWGAQVAGLCGPAGCAAGGGVMFPPVRVFSARMEAQASLLGGSAGVYLHGSAGLRF